MRPSVRRRLSAAVFLLLMLSASCTRLPRVGEPVSPSDISALAESLGAGEELPASLRGAGEGRIRVSGRTLRVSFAVVYERPGWLRADIRPALGGMGASLTALALLEDGCASLYFPSRLVEVTGCLSDLPGVPDWLDASALLLGVPDPAFISRLTDVELRRADDRAELVGRWKNTHVTIDIDTSMRAMTRLEFTGEDEADVLVLEYGGHGWKEGLRAPQTTVLTALEGTTREVMVELRYDSLKRGGPVERDEYALDIPPGVLVVDWRDLSIWR